ncbi:alcohol dehydrogenase catalytic domain-containing protein [Mycolicibacterium hippocampi]|uniref:Alcohol dehydrogenase n=1 Tax=Mycolicibacterium hippocampi TaxID=659824 RepID=A0A850PKV0_9MYCO|nr:alcohol dehydrogenase catalytic domain-containing protein [Mycolicibacterium hippocampi]NVN49357.1 alcohol dehydrogenase [Mycolicibacterium hippocampi]
MTGQYLRPQSTVAHYARLLTPDALVAGRLSLDRDVGMRARRIAGVVRAARKPARSRMRALVASPGGAPAWKSVTRPSLPGPQGALVRPIAVATCDVDRAMMLGRSIFPLPLHLGHECVAEVVEVGSQVASVGIGDRVVVPFQISCGCCAPCRRGHTANCLSVPPTSMYGFGLAGGLWGGALTDLMAVPFAEAMLVPLPKGVDPAAAAGVADNVSDCYRQVAPHLPALLAADGNAETLIVGRLNAGHPFTPSAVLITALIARALGGRRISVVDGRPALQRRAEALGFTALDPRRPREWPVAPLTVDATGTPAGLRAVLKHTAPEGICSCVWSLHRRGSIRLSAAYIRNVTLHIGRAHVRALIPAVLDLIASGKLQPELVTTNVANFDEAPQALDEHCHGEALKTVLLADA